MASYRPSGPYNKPMLLLVPKKSIVKGTVKKVYPKIEEMSEADVKKFTINASFRSFGGTESLVNGVYTVIDTANVETWFRPDIESDCRVLILGTEKIYDVVGEPENIEMRNQFMKFKVKRYKGGV